MRSTNCTHTIIPASMPPSTGWPSWLKRVINHLLACGERHRQRQQLACLSDTALKDIGLTRSDVQREIAKPFWHP